MSVYTKLKILLTIVLSVIISYLTYTYIKNLSDQTTIIITTQDINPHTIITSDMIHEIQISKKDKANLASDAISTKSEFDNAISKERIEKGKVLEKDKNVIAGTREELIEQKAMLENGEINNAYFISDNMRITTVALESDEAVGGKLNIGDYVDVIFSHTGDENTSFSTIIMEHIQIYDIEDSIEDSLGTSKNVSLVVTPQQSVDIIYAKRQGKIDLALNSSKGNSETTYSTAINKFISKDNSDYYTKDAESDSIN